MTAFKDESGRVLFRAASLQDISALKRTEEELRESVRSRDEFLQIASHELKTPLTPLQLQLDTLAQLARSSGLASRNGRLSQMLETATRQAARLASLVESLLDVSRITAGQVELDLERLDLAEIVRDLAERFRPQSKGGLKASRSRLRRASAMGRSESRSRTTALDRPQQHALARLAVGFDLDEVITEYSLLRQCILTLGERDVGATIAVSELRRLEAALDQ